LIGKETKYSKIVQLSTFLAVAVLSSTVSIPNAFASTVNSEVSAPETLSFSTLISQRTDAEVARQNPEAIAAYASSEYGYWDAVVLADFWGRSTYESKAVIGQKLQGGGDNLENLERTLVDARAQALESVRNRDLRYYQQFVEERAGRFTYDDVVKLAEYWGIADPQDAKLALETYLVSGNFDELAEAMRAAL